MRHAWHAFEELEELKIRRPTWQDGRHTELRKETVEDSGWAGSKVCVSMARAALCHSELVKSGPTLEIEVFEDKFQLIMP